MRNTLLALLCAVSIASLAQTSFKLNTSTPTREYHEVAAVYNNGYILKFTSLDPMKRGTGTFKKYSTDNKPVLQKPYKIDLGFKTMPFSDLMILKDNKAWLGFGGAGNGDDVPLSGCVMRWKVRVKDYSLQPFDLNTLQVTGTPKIIGVPTKKDIGLNSLLRSPKGTRFAIIATEYNVENTFKYKLMDASGNELFTKEYTVPYIKNWKSIDDGSIELTETGELAFVVGDYLDYKDPAVYLVRIDANQKMFTKKVDTKGKSIARYVNAELAEDGSLTAEMSYYKDAKSKEVLGKIIQKYSPTLELIDHKEVAYPENLASGRLRKLEGGGYVAISKQTGQRQTGPQKWDNTYSNYSCVGYDDNFKELYRYDIHKVESSSNWCIYRPFGEYIEGDKIYVFHGGTDDKVKNTKDEFEVYCTYWQHNKTKPQTVKLQLPFPDLNLDIAWYREMDKNKLFMTGEGNGGKVYTTLLIE